MRNTGMRIGELISLPYQCVRTDLQRNNFLKVPLGKLDNERLVPLDTQTFALIEEIQAQKPSPRTFLFEIAHKKKVSYNNFRQSLQHATHDIVLPEPITSHRLRHSYATSLLSAGMSLQAIMRLLGHRDINMTLRYADVTLDTVRKEFFEANTKTQARYAQTHKLNPKIFDPIPAVIDLIAWLKKIRSTESIPQKTQAQRLINRTQNLKNDLENFAQSLK
jgi:integrase